MMTNLKDDGAADGTGGDWRIVALAGIVFLFDGFDTQVIAFVGPTLTRDFGLSLAALGPLLTLGMVGGLIGALGLGALSDRVGRRLALTFCVLLFSAGTFATAFVQDFGHFAFLRLVTGIGLGGALPTLYAVSALYAPAGKRALVVTLASCGNPLGGAIGGLLCAMIVPGNGWRIVFEVGGVLPLLVLPFIWRMIRPRSPAILQLPEAAEGASKEGTSVGYLAALFAGSRRFGTPLLWMICVPATLTAYFLVNWTPALADRAGLTVQMAMIAGVAVNLGGIIGGLLMSGLMDRFGPFRVMGSGFMVSAIAIGAIGWTSAFAVPLLLNMLVVGIAAIGCSMCVGTLATLFYPDSVRGIGVGFAMLFARTGAILGPLVGGIMVGAGFSTTGLFLVVAAASLLAFVAVAGLAFVSHRYASRHPASAPAL
jgi:AAHS family 4-hydroxybenzoate transporter-like MFS transporter